MTCAQSRRVIDPDNHLAEWSCVTSATQGLSLDIPATSWLSLA